MFTDKLMIGGLAALGVAVVGAVIYFTLKAQTEAMIAAAKEAGKAEWAAEASKSANAGDEVLARARDPDAVEKALEAGTV